MCRNMQEVLERWGRWAAREEYCSLVDWPSLSILPCHKPQPGKPGCTNEDGIVVDTCIAHMSKICKADYLQILGQRFIGGHALRRIAKDVCTSKDSVVMSLRTSEAFVEGCLTMLAVHLDMDLEVRRVKKDSSRQNSVLKYYHLKF